MRRNWTYLVLMVSVSLTGIISVASAGAAWEPVQTFKVPVQAPDLTLKDVNGREYSLSKLKGKVVLINFFTTW